MAGRGSGRIIFPYGGGIVSLPASYGVKPSYRPIDEDLAKEANDLNTHNRYRKGSATEEYRSKVDAVYALAERLKADRDEGYWPRIDAMADDYAKRLADWTNSHNSALASGVSILVAGPSGYRGSSSKYERLLELRAERQRIESIPEAMAKVGDVRTNVSVRDPMAGRMLDRQIEEAEAEQARMKRVNAYYRKHRTVIGCPDVPAGMQEIFQRTIEEPGRFSDKPYDDSDLASARERVKRLKSKREQLESAKSEGSSTRVYGDMTVIEDADSMTVRIMFPYKPEDEVRLILRRCGFKWSPKAGAWQRTLNDAGKAAAKDAIARIGRLDGSGPI